ncbi:unnamed protein product [Spirodela intermedia]|uniref:Uncharacterized protein n=1 Tax=Spirodela intermedia TaxID=51605 RepID=A0A7I8JVY4_SPIIN|nr:unnamed protein product [Spirodela intermedia]CAA6673813.1 unnamed protein product [Spirodela intermedia]
MLEQLELFREYVERLKTIAGETKALAIVSESLYVLCAGADDICNTYFTTPYRRTLYDVPSYVSLLVSSAELANLGARRIAFVGLPPIGCVNRNCDPSLNHAASLFNSKMSEELQRISNQHHGRRIAVFGIYSMVLDMIQDPSYYGFDVATKGCCGTGALEVSDDDRYVFWDSFHPTERTYDIITDAIVEKCFRACCRKTLSFLLRDRALHHSVITNTFLQDLV